MAAEDKDFDVDLLERTIMEKTTISLEAVLQKDYKSLQLIGAYSVLTFCSYDSTLLTLKTVSVNEHVIRGLIKWLVKNLKQFDTYKNTITTKWFTKCLLIMLAVFAQKENYYYRKVTNDKEVIDKQDFIAQLRNTLVNNPHYISRAGAFVLLAAIDDLRQDVIIESLNSIIEENRFKQYLLIGIPLIKISPNEYISDLLKEIECESVVKSFHLLKILTRFASDERIDDNKKKNVLNSLMKHINDGRFEKQISFYYSDLKLQFTTTLQTECYNAWIELQGLSGKKE